MDLTPKALPLKGSFFHHPVNIFNSEYNQAEDNFLRKKGYTIGGKLGSGSYATVKSAMWKKPGSPNLKQVALKIINMINVPKDFRDKFLPRELEVCFFCIIKQVTRC